MSLNSIDNEILNSLCSDYCEIVRQINELSEKKESLKKQIIAEMPSKREITTRFKVYKIQQLIVTTSLESAKALGCTIIKENVDKKALERLYEEGVDVPDVRLSEWVRVVEK